MDTILSRTIYMLFVKVLVNISKASPSHATLFSVFCITEVDSESTNGFLKMRIDAKVTTSLDTIIYSYRKRFYGTQSFYWSSPLYVFHVAKAVPFFSLV